jgi:hypothetical protein
MKAKIPFTIVLILCLSLTSCSKDDDNNNNTEICNNGIDDDSDGQIDCDDGDCAEDDNCTELESDYRLKQDISQLKYGLTEVLQLDTKSYSYISDDSREMRMGFMAQDVQLIMPELVKVDASNKHLKLKYMDVMAILVNAIKEQQKIIEINQQHIEILTCEIEQQKLFK